MKKRNKPRVWTSRNGRQTNVVDMATDHLINTVTLLVRDQMKRKYGLRPEFGLTDDEIVVFFGAMMDELNARQFRKSR